MFRHHNQGYSPLPTYSVKVKYGYSESELKIPTDNIFKVMKKLKSVGFEILGFSICEVERPPLPQKPMK